MMSIPLFDAVPGFDQPVAVLKHCHNKIRKQLATLDKLPEHLARHGATIEAQQAASAVLQYFNQAAELHHADEEQDLMPMLRALAVGADAALLDALVPQILADHQRMERLWLALRPPLEAIAAGAAAALAADQVAPFGAAYLAHMTLEETQLAPMALRLFDAERMAQLGAAMQARRGIGGAPAS